MSNHNSNIHSQAVDLSPEVMVFFTDCGISVSQFMAFQCYMTESEGYQALPALGHLHRYLDGTEFLQDCHEDYLEEYHALCRLVERLNDQDGVVRH